MREINLLPNLESESRQKRIWPDFFCVALPCLAVLIIFLVKEITVHKIQELQFCKNKLIEKQSRFVMSVSDMNLLTHEYAQLQNTVGLIQHNRDQIIKIFKVFNELALFAPIDTSIVGFKYERDHISFFLLERSEREFLYIMERVCRKYNLYCQHIGKIDSKNYSIFRIKL